MCPAWVGHFPDTILLPRHTVVLVSTHWLHGASARDGEAKVIREVGVLKLVRGQEERPVKKLLSTQSKPTAHICKHTHISAVDKN